MALSTAFCWLAWAMVILYINPFQAGILGFLFFYVSLLLALIGTFSLAGFLIRIILIKKEVISKLVGISFRQAILFAVLIVGLLFLQSKQLLTWWNILLLVLALTILEFFFISYRTSQHNQ